MALNLYNTLSKKTEEFKPLTDVIGLYTCGPTVYNYAHIGNLRTYVFEDILKRTLWYFGYHSKHVMNITDVGHLTDDADAGEDKMEKGSRREGKSAWEIAEFYTTEFLKDTAKLHIIPSDILCKATDHIKEQITMVEMLTSKGFTYETPDGIYFDTTKFPNYGELVDLKNQTLEAGIRVDMAEKKNPHDFALWKFTPAGETRQMEWEAFGRKGFPGWHIECSAMALKYLGDHFDIHCGAVDHKSIHHTNEIAQTEATTGKSPWVNVWMHGEFLNIKNGDSVDKMAKSGENFLTLSRLVEKGYDPLVYRFYLLGAHYRSPLNFSFEALDAAKNGFNKLKDIVDELGDEQGSVIAPYAAEFKDALADDLNMPKALAVMWKLLKDTSLSNGDKRMTLINFDKVLGLGLENTVIEIPSDVQKLLAEREASRLAKDFAKSDELREQILALGFNVKDTDAGQKAFPLRS